MNTLFWKNFGFISGAEIILRAKGLFLMPLLTAYLGTVNYGAWAQVSLLVTFGPLLIMLGTDHGITRYLPGETPAQKGRWFSGWFLFGTVGAFLFCLICFLFQDSLALVLFGDVETYSPFVPLAGAYVALNVILAMGRRWFRIHHDGAVFSIISLAQAVVSILAAVLMWQWEQGIYELLVYTLIGEGLITFLIGVHLLRKYGFYAPDFSILKKAMIFGLPLVPAGIAMWVINLSDRLFLLHMKDLHTVGVYSVGYSIATIISTLLIRPVKFMYPVYSSELYNQEKFEEYNSYFNFTVLLTSAIMLPGIIGLWLVGPEIINLLATDEFKETAPIISMVALGAYLNIVGVYFTRGAELKGYSYITTVIVTSAMIINIVLNYLLIPPFGIYGAAFATIAAFAVRAFIGAVLAERIYKVLALRWAMLFRFILASLCMGTATQFLVSSVFSSDSAYMLVLVIKVLCGLVFYGLFLVLFGLVTPDQIRLLLSARSKGDLMDFMNGVFYSKAELKNGN